jgi:hypothetical protein
MSFWTRVRDVALPIAAGFALGPAGIGLISTFQAFGVAALVYQNRAQARAARRSSEAARRQPEITSKSSEAPRIRVYGRARVGGNLVYSCTHGDEKEYVSFVIVLAAHECDAIEDVILDNESLGTLDGSGYVQAGSPWFIQKQEAIGQNVAATAGTVTLSRVPSTTATLALITGTASGESADQSTPTYVNLTLGIDYTHTAPSQTVTLAGEYAGQTIAAENLVANYQSPSGVALVRVRKYLGAAGQSADSTLITDSGGEWNSSRTLSGQCYMIVTFKYNENRTVTGMPNLSAIVRGAKIYDPRSGLTVWENNWALCVRDYIKFAFGATDAEIGSTNFTQSANTSDELVTLADGTTRRYTCDGVLYSDRRRADNLEDLLASGAGSAIWSAGKWEILCGKYRSPVSISFTDADFVGAFNYTPEAPRPSAANTIKGTFYDARVVGGVALYTRTDYQSYASSAYLTEDNNEPIVRTLDLPMTTDYRVANRVAKQVLRRSRQGATLVFTTGAKAFPLQVGDVIPVTNSKLGLISKNFEILDIEADFPASVKLTTVEADSSAYDWTYSEVAFLDPAPNTYLPDPRNIEMPIVLCRSSAIDNALGLRTLDILSDGTRVPYVELSWAARAVQGEYIVIQWKRSFETTYRTIEARVGDTKMKLLGVSGGDLITVIAVARNSLGAESLPFINQAYLVDEGLPSANASGQPQSSNMLPSATFEDGVIGKWGNPYGQGGTLDSQITVQRHPLPAYYVSGTPGSVHLAINDATAGTGRSAVWPSAVMALKEGKRYCAYARLIGWGTDSFVAIQWLDINLQAIGIVASDQPVAGVVVEDPVRRWNDPQQYRLCPTAQDKPDGARYARLLIVAGGTWAAGSKYLSIIEPYFGELEQGDDMPPFGAGPGTPVSTSQIAKGATTQLVPFESADGFTLTTDSWVFRDFPLTTFVAAEAGTAEITVTFAVYGACPSGGSASTISAGLYISDKRGVTERPIFTIAPGSAGSTTVTLSASVDVVKGQTIPLALRLSRSRFGIGTGSTTDRAYSISGRITNVMR